MRKVVESLDKYLSKKYDDTFELDGIKVEYVCIEQSRGMGSYATFYIDFSINETEGITIRYSGHENSTADYYLWNDDFSSMKEIKNAIDDIIKQEVNIEMPKRQQRIKEVMAKLNKSDIRYSRNTDVDEFDENKYNVVNTTGLKRYGELKSEVMTWDNIKYPNQVRCIELASKGFYMYKMLDNDTKDILVFKPKNKYARRQYNEIRRAYRRGVNGITVPASTLFENIRNGGYDDRNISRNGQGQLDNDATLNAESLRPKRNSNGRGSLENDNNDNLSERLDKHSRNTRLNYDENFDDVNDAFEQAIKVLQNIKGIDVSSEFVEEVGKAQRNIDKELDGYHA